MGSVKVTLNSHGSAEVVHRLPRFYSDDPWTVMDLFM
jgi:hypothetical protein